MVYFYEVVNNTLTESTMNDKKNETEKQFWVSFFSKVSIIAITLLSLLWVVSVAIGCIWGTRPLNKMDFVATVVIVPALTATVKFGKVCPAFNKGTRWDFTTGCIQAGLVLAAGYVAIPPWSALLCLNVPNRVCISITGTTLAAIDVIIAIAILLKTDYYDKHTGTKHINS